MEQSRPGFYIYHEDAKMLCFADDSTIADIFRKLSHLSADLDDPDEILPIESDNGMVIALYQSMAMKIIRDAKKYAGTCKDKSIARKIGHIQKEYKDAGKEISKSEARQKAEEWYTQQFTDVHGSIERSTHVESTTHDYSNGNCNSNRNVTLTPTVTTTSSATVTQPQQAVPAPPAHATEIYSRIEKVVSECARGNVNDSVKRIVKNAARDYKPEVLLDMVQHDASFRSKLFIASMDNSSDIDFSHLGKDQKNEQQEEGKRRRTGTASPVP